MSEEKDWSKYQQAIFEWVKDGQGNAFVDAAAGSGKTTTLVEAAGCLPQKRTERLKGDVLFCAFNKHIADELSTKLPSGAIASTIHGLGARALKSYLHKTRSSIKDTDLWTRKYDALCQRHLDKISPKIASQIEDCLEELIHFAQITLTLPDTSSDEAMKETQSSLQALIERYDLDIEIKDKEVWDALARGVDEIIKAGAEEYRETGRIDFTDMIFLPVYLDIAPKKYDFIFVDESQDLNACQLELVLSARKENTRMLFCGDPRQSMYGFIGADTESVQNIIERCEAELFSLSICYRCPSSHIELAQRIHPDGIEASPTAECGIVEVIKSERVNNVVAPGDYIICRTNAPLVSRCLSLVRSGVRAVVLGRDIGKSVLAMLRKIEQQQGFHFEKIATWANTYLEDQIEILRKDEGTQREIAVLRDKIETLKALHAGYLEENRKGSLKDFKRYTENFFKPESDEDGKKIDYSGVVRLSSVHKAKGLEADRVFIDHPEQLPFPFAKDGWQTVQECNIAYVALTRAKKTLYFIDKEPNWNKLAPSYDEQTEQGDNHPCKGENSNMPKVSPRYDIKSLIERYATLKVVNDALVHGVREYHSNCPWCGGTDRFITRPETGQYSCSIRSSGCGRVGDCLDFLRDYCDMSYMEACEELGLDPDRPDWTAANYDESSKENAPSKKWQEMGMLIVERAERYLWHPKSPEGQQTLAYLRGRGLTDETIKKARLGYCPLGKDGRWYMGSFEEWGIDPDTLTETQRDKGGVRVPNGIIIPWFCQGQLWKIAIKRPGEKMDYGQVLGSGEGLYNVDSVQFEQPAMMVEGEFDCLSVIQEAGDVIACVATGSDRRGRIGRWIGELTLASFVLQSFDRDTPNRETGERSGDLGAEYWLEVLPNAMRWQPWADEWGEQLRFKDPNECLQHAAEFKEFTGYTLRGWVEAGIETAMLPTPKLPNPEPPDKPSKPTILPHDDMPSEQAVSAEIDRLEQFADTVAKMAKMFGDAIVTKATGQTIEERARELRSSYEPVTLPALPRNYCPHLRDGYPCFSTPLAGGWCKEHIRSGQLLDLGAQLGYPEIELPFDAGYGKRASRIISPGIVGWEAYAEIAPEQWLIRDMARIREKYGLLRLVG